MQQEINPRYVPKNWPVDDGIFKPINQDATQEHMKKAALPVRAVLVLEGCFRAKQQSYIRKKSWI